MHDDGPSEQARPSARGRFIVVDGPNGSGKSTVIASMARAIRSSGMPVLCTREPSDSALGQWIRASQDHIAGRALACLITANRHEQLDTVIIPALAAGTVVIADRYLASSFVYQIHDGLSPDYIWNINTGVLEPDITFLLYADAEVISSRMAARNTKSRFEKSLDPARELSLYRDAGLYLSSCGWIVSSQHNDGAPADVLAGHLLRMALPDCGAVNG